MEEKVYKNIMSHVELDSNILKAKWYVTRDSLTRGLAIDGMYELNGVRRRFSTTTPYGTQPQEALKQVRDELIRSLAETILMPLVIEHSREIIHNA